MIAIADNPNLAILEMAVQALGELTDSLVFVGGCATGLLVTGTRGGYPIKLVTAETVIFL